MSNDSGKNRLGKYPDEMRILAAEMYTNNDSYEEIGFKLGISKSTAHAWVKQQINSLDMSNKDLAEGIKNTLRAKNYIQVNRVMNALGEDNLKEVKPRDKAVISGILMDNITKLDNKDRGSENVTIIQNYIDKGKTRVEEIDEEAEQLKLAIEKAEKEIELDG